MGAVFEEFKKEVVEKAEKEGYLKAIKVVLDQELVSDEEIIKVYRLTPGDLRKIKELN